jgi:hypothetical protein
MPRSQAPAAACRAAPSGSLHLLDFCGRRDLSDGLRAPIAHHNRRLHKNLDDRIPTLMRQAGLAAETGHRVGAVGRYTRDDGRACGRRPLWEPSPTPSADWSRSDTSPQR